MEFKDRDTMIEDVLEAIQSNMEFEIEIGDGEPLRNIIEAVIQEIDLQYWQLEQVYENSFIDTAYGEELSKLVKILGIERRPAIKSEGSVRFYRETEADSDYLIPMGTRLETLPDYEGNTISFETIENAVLLKDTKEVTARISAVEAGSNTNLTANKIIIINDPPTGIESVTNDYATIGGEEEETDEELKERAISSLETSGRGTINAILNRLRNTPGVKSVAIEDLARGVGTFDILVLGDTIPMPLDKRRELENIVNEIKSGGIDALLEEPSVKTVDVSIKLNIETSLSSTDLQNVNNSIVNYFSSIQIGKTAYVNQLSKYILNSNSNIIDVEIISPANNVVAEVKEIIILGNTTISENIITQGE